MTVDIRKIADLQRQKDALLEGNNSLKGLQMKIDETLKKAGPNIHNRLVMLSTLMTDQAYILTEAMLDLRNDCSKLRDLMNEYLESHPYKTDSNDTTKPPN